VEGAYAACQRAGARPARRAEDVIAGPLFARGNPERERAEAIARVAVAITPVPLGRGGDVQLAAMRESGRGGWAPRPRSYHRR
jgi:hypothetical protein